MTKHNKRKGKGWYNDKPQHILAGKGIPTKAKANDIPKGTTLTPREWLHQTEDGKEFLKDNFSALYEIPWDKAGPVPYHTENVDFEDSDKLVSISDEEIMEHVEGLKDHRNYGDVEEGEELLDDTKWEDNPLYEDKEFVYVGTHSAPREMEVQVDTIMSMAEDDYDLDLEQSENYVTYGDIGHSYFRIWMPKDRYEELKEELE